MKVASIQLNISEKRTKKQQISHVLDMLNLCVGSDLIVLPELWNIGFYNFENYYAEAEDENGTTMSAISTVAQKLKCYIYSGTFVEQRNGKFYNSGILFDRQGRDIAKYSKMHLFGYGSREAELLTPGDEIVVANTEFGKIGIATCYDLRFPELFRKMALDFKAELFIVSAAWPASRINTWNILNCARAIENQCYLISSNCTGKYINIQGGGNGKIISPEGDIIADSNFEEEIIRAEIDTDNVKKIRKNFPVLNGVKTNF